MTTNLIEDLEKEKREAKLLKINTEFYVKLQFGLGDDEFDRILFSEFFDSQGNVK
jgi:hypothetical protein